MLYAALMGLALGSLAFVAAVPWLPVPASCAAWQPPACTWDMLWRVSLYLLICAAFAVGVTEAVSRVRGRP